MKVYIPNSSKDISELKGRSLFCYRLAKVFRSKGVFVTDDLKDKVDASLNVIRIKHDRSRVKVLRLDGVWHDTGKKFRDKNRGLIESLKKADGVIYQSFFAERMCDEYLGAATCPTTMIFNGSDPSFYENIIPANTSRENVFITFSKWRPHKRLRDIIESFLLADIPNSLLIIAGDTTKCGVKEKVLLEYFKHPKIAYIGSVTQNVLARYLVASKASIHLCWFDACPNNVVESIVAGVPVICNNVGGTWELVAPSGGYICNVDSPYDLNPVDLYHPPKIDRRIVAEALIKCLEEEPKVSRDHLLIENVANQYLDFMKRLLNA